MYVFVGCEYLYHLRLTERNSFEATWRWCPDYTAKTKIYWWYWPMLIVSDSNALSSQRSTPNTDFLKCIDRSWSLVESFHLKFDNFFIYIPIRSEMDFNAVNDFRMKMGFCCQLPQSPSSELLSFSMVTHGDLAN